MAELETLRKEIENAGYYSSIRGSSPDQYLMVGSNKKQLPNGISTVVNVLNIYRKNNSWNVIRPMAGCVERTPLYSSTEPNKIISKTLELLSSNTARDNNA